MAITCPQSGASAIILGGIDLPDGYGNQGKIDWTDRYSYLPIESEIKRSIGGRLHYREKALSNGSPVTLEASEGKCWLSEAQKDSIIILAGNLGTLQLDYEGEQHDCIFNRSDGAFSFERKRIASNTWWYGIIRLIIVS